MANVFLGADKTGAGPVVRATSSPGKAVTVTVDDAVFLTASAADKHALATALRRIADALSAGGVVW